jgi:hypothetical protein
MKENIILSILVKAQRHVFKNYLQMPRIIFQNIHKILL